MASPSAESSVSGPVALISTTRVVIDPLHRAAVEGSPDTPFLHFVDEGILAEKARAGEITPGIIDWLEELLERAVRSGAFRALSSGRTEDHDAAVVSAIEDLATDHDAVILAQISITRVRERLPEDPRRLTRSSLDYIGDIISGKFD